MGKARYFPPSEKIGYFTQARHAKEQRKFLATTRLAEQVASALADDQMEYEDALSGRRALINYLNTTDV